MSKNLFINIFKLVTLSLVLLSTSLSAGEYKNKWYKLNLKYHDDLQPVEKDVKHLLLSLDHKEKIASFNIYAYTYAEPVTIDGFQIKRQTLGYDGWINLGGRYVSKEELDRSNTQAGYVSIYSKKELLSPTQYEYRLVAEYYFVKENRGYVLSVSTKKKHWSNVDHYFKSFVKNFWVGEGVQPIVFHTSSTEGDWEFFGQNSQNHNAISSRFVLNDKSKKYWEYQLSNNKQFLENLPPLFMQGQVISATLNQIMCISAYDGKEIWQFDLPRNYRIKYLAGHKETVYAVLVGEKDYVYGLSLKTGETLFRIKLQSEPQSPPIVSGNKLFMVEDDTLKAYFMKNKKVLWKKFISFKEDTYPVIQGNNLIVLEEGNKIMKLNSHTGQKQWVQLLSSPVISSPIIFKKQLILSQVKNKDGSFFPYVQSIDLNTGQPIWRYEESILYKPLGFNMSVSNKMLFCLFVRGFKNVIVALDIQTGAKIWEYSGYQFSINEKWVVPTISNQYVFILKPGAQNNLVALDIITGKETYTLSLTNLIKNPNLNIGFFKPYKSYMLFNTLGPNSRIVSLK